MRYEDDKKKLVKQRYNELALVKNAESMKKCCCNPAVPSQKVFTIVSEDYSKLNGYEPDADLGVGCGLPTQYAGIKPGDTLLILGEAETGLIVSRPDVLNNLADEILNNVKKED